MNKPKFLEAQPIKLDNNIEAKGPILKSSENLEQNKLNQNQRSKRRFSNPKFANVIANRKFSADLRSASYFYLCNFSLWSCFDDLYEMQF